MKDDKFSKIFSELSTSDKEWVLNYLSSGKGTIQYEMITDFDSLNISPDKDFFEIHQFYPSMKDTVISDEEYQNVKRFYKLLKMSNLGELNKIYNFQDTIILCELFEHRSDLSIKIFKFYPRRCNSASSFSGCVHRSKNKCCIALPTDADYVRLFEKTLIEGFSCVNTRLAFDTNILLKDTGQEKVLVEISIDGKKQLKKVLVHNFKNGREQPVWNGHGKAITIWVYKKEDKVPLLTEFNKILDRITHNDSIGHLFTVDIKFHDIKEKTLFFNELYPPVFQKNKRQIFLRG